ncbi:YgeY family selenium metabolism-linked hydrolase [Phototrophicus methaneseepsis]|uniref:YgeY family selenium metabolism-linked hydrolase n=1 Tax=Phototrophicus methaneseepsis TaxID=2710758 RepID=A0A7S8ICG2_9CHLR|nr:YgeY family selenium metabolism-linked hydrolase [Phototrophicus methaneseepsis]QPC81510.1 YgeY family selenium metabolism-linked hydrolase [Phototrophicus methaneseepsis]
MVEQATIDKIKVRVQEQRDDILTFFREIVAIPSMESQIHEVGERVEAEMKKLGFDEVFWDKMGNVVGRIGDGDKILLYDSHIDTVGIGDPDEWEWDPFQGKVEDGVFFARGACDEKNSTPGMIYGLALAKELGLLEGITAYYFGNMEEWNDGSAPHAFVQTEGIKPDFVVIGEPTKMQVYRGQKGRVEFGITAKGKSAHAASNYLGDNAIYKLLPIIERIKDLEPELGDHDYLGHGRITVTDMHVKTPSINAVPDEATIYVDRRVTLGETPEGELARLQEIVGDRSDITVEILMYEVPSYTGFVFPLEKIYPAWLLEEEHPLVQAGVAAGKAAYGAMGTGKWDFSTNGIYWAGKAGIPSIGFGPGDEIHAHTVLDQVKLDDVVSATEWYALLPAMLP